MFLYQLNRLLNFLPRKNFKTLNLIKINRQNILDNYDLIQKLNPNCQIWPVLKSNAYGHGLAQITQILKARKFNYLIADSYYEALEIHKINPSQKVLLIGSTHPDNFPFLNFKYTTICIQDFISLKKLAELNRSVNFHLKINTGMNRQGIEPAEINKYCQFIQKHPKLNFEGVFSHLADADNSDNSFTQKQLNLFISCLEKIRKNNLSPKYCHLSATAGSAKIFHPSINALRLGLGLYGYNPLTPQDSSFKTIDKLKPALSLYSSIIKTRILGSKDKVSYNLTYQAKQKTQTAILPLGYNEGLDRNLSNCGFVKYQGKFLPIIGRVCMNLTIIDTLDAKPKFFDPVEIISPHSKDLNSIENIAKTCHTIPYVILIHLHSSIRRQIV